MQLRDVDLRSVGHSSQKLWPVMDFLNFALCKSFVFVGGPVLREGAIYGQTTFFNFNLYWSKALKNAMLCYF